MLAFLRLVRLVRHVRLRFVALLAVVLVASACSSNAEETTVHKVDEVDEADEADEVNVTTATTTTGEASPKTEPFTSAGSSVNEVRTLLGAEKLVARSGDVVMAASEGGTLELTADFPLAFRNYIVDDNRIIDYDGQVVCPGFELLGDFHAIDQVELTEDSLMVTVEDRRALATESASAETEIPRWGFRCDDQERVELPSRTSVEHQQETKFERVRISDDLSLVVEIGIGDTPLRVTTGAGTILIDHLDLAYDYTLSPDAKTMFFTSYSGSGAAEPPEAVVAVDTSSGAELWRLDIPGYALPLGDQLVIQAVDTTALSDLGLFPGSHLVVVEPATGVELLQIPFTGRLIGLF